MRRATSNVRADLTGQVSVKVPQRDVPRSSAFADLRSDPADQPRKREGAAATRSSGGRSGRRSSCRRQLPPRRQLLPAGRPATGARRSSGAAPGRPAVATQGLAAQRRSVGLHGGGCDHTRSSTRLSSRSSRACSRPQAAPLLIDSVHASTSPLEGRVVPTRDGTPRVPRGGVPHTRWRSGVLPAVHVAHLELTSDDTDEA